MICSNFYKKISTAKVLNNIYFNSLSGSKQVAATHFLTNVKRLTNFIFSATLKKRNRQRPEKL